MKRIVTTPARKPHKVVSTDEAVINHNFGQQLAKLRKNRSLTLATMAEQLTRQARQSYSPQYLNKVERGSVPPSDMLIRALADFFGENYARLCCLAGRPPLVVRLDMSQRPERYLELSHGRNQFRLAVTSAAWAGHVLAAAKIKSPEIYRTNFECQTVTTGFEALNLLLAHQTDFAVVSRAALERVRADHNPAAALLVELLDLHVTRAESFYYRYFPKSVHEPRAWGALSTTRAEELMYQFVAEQNHDRRKKDWTTVVPCQDFDELVDHLCKGKIDGFAGWPFLNLRAERALALHETGGKQCLFRQLELQAEILKDEQSFTPILHLVTTQDFLTRRESPDVLHDLIGKIITACEFLNGVANKQKNLFETLSPYLVDQTGETYLTLAAIDWHIQQIIFDATLRERAFRNLFIGRPRINLLLDGAQQR